MARSAQVTTPTHSPTSPTLAERTAALRGREATDAHLANAWCWMIGRAEYQAEQGDDSLLVQMEHALAMWGRR